MKQLQVLVISFTLLSTPIYAVDNSRITTVKGMSMGFNGVTQTMTFNPAVLSWENNVSIETQFNNRYALKELSTYSLSCILPNKVLDVGFSATTFGSSFYRETTIGLIVGKELLEKVTLGGAVYYSFQNIINTQSNTIAFDVGTSYIHNEYLKFSLAALNLMGNYDLRAGFVWDINPVVSFVGEISHSKVINLSGSVGVEYKPTPPFRIRAGIITQSMQPTFGLGYQWANFTLEGALSYHHMLGLSSAIGLKYIFK